LSKPYTTDAEAYQLYLKGRYHANQGTAEGLKKSVEYFQRAIGKDPAYAMAYAGLADSYGSLGSAFIYLPPSETLPKAKAAAMKALELDDTLAEAHAALAYAEFYGWNWPGAERELKRAIELNPGSAISHMRYSEYLYARARFDESIAEGFRAQELDPLSPFAVAQLAFDYGSARRFDEAISQFQKALDLDPSSSWIRSGLASAYAANRRYAQAIAEFDKIAEQDKTVTAENQWVVSCLGFVYAVSGRRADALRTANELKDLSSHAYVDFYLIAQIYAVLGEKDMALQWLGRGYEEHSSNMVYLAIDPQWDGMRSDPRFADLLRRMRLPQ